MELSRLDIQNVRNLREVSLSPLPGLNLIVGDNASGKTSLLEAIYLLSHGRSFRSANVQTVVNHNAETLQVVGQVFQPQTGQNVRLGIERGVNTSRIRINQESVQQTSRLASYLPVQIINPESHQLFEQGPNHRRRFLDWGLFHVEHRFLSTWQQYTRVLKQRNAVLRQGGSADAVKLWDRPLVELGTELDGFRRDYLESLREFINDAVKGLLEVEIQLDYQNGWIQGKTLEQAVSDGLPIDQKQGFTRNGPHRAELRILSEGHPVKEQCSRGQQKLLVCAMRIAQMAHLKQHHNQQSVMLVDDLAAELDADRRQRLLALLQSTEAQSFVTVTEASLVDVRAWHSHRVFHVEHGKVSEVV